MLLISQIYSKVIFIRLPDFILYVNHVTYYDLVVYLGSIWSLNGIWWAEKGRPIKSVWYCIKKRPSNLINWAEMLVGWVTRHLLPLTLGIYMVQESKKKRSWELLNFNSPCLYMQNLQKILLLIDIPHKYQKKPKSDQSKPIISNCTN